SLLTLELADIVRAYGPAHPIAKAALMGQATPRAAADLLLSTSALADSTRANIALSAGLPTTDPAPVLAASLVPAMSRLERDFGALLAEEREIAGDLGRARFAVFGRGIPPDGTFSPRIADGVVQGYAYNGTLAPPFTTFYGMYERFRANGPGTEWD